MVLEVSSHQNLLPQVIFFAQTYKNVLMEVFHWFLNSRLLSNTDFARSALSPPSRFPCAPHSCGERGLLAGLARRVPRLRSGLRSSNQNPLG
jgi:hypothetical protein